jgi:hypothetical protein
MRELIEAERAGEIEPFFVHASRLYSEDSNPASSNRAPRECWPSTQLFRRAFHMAGTARGTAAIALLDRVPDEDLRLFSTITLAAALSGLPEMRLSQSTFRPYG